MSDILGMVAIAGSQALTTAVSWTENINNIVSVICTAATAITTTAVIIYNMWKHKKTKSELYGDDNVKDEVQKDKCEVEIIKDEPKNGN